MRRFFRLLAIATLVFMAAFAAAFLLGPERLWAQFGPADLGEVDFATLERRASPNDALGCLPEFCKAEADIPAPVIAKPLAEVFQAVQDAVAQEPRLEQVGADAATGSLRFVQRTPLMRFPDTINVKVVTVADGSTAVLIYSRSQIGKGDMGVNLARVKRWAELIGSAAGKQ